MASSPLVSMKGIVEMENLFDLSGKVAIITGGNGGIGFGIASGLATAGATVVVAARDQKKSERAVKRLKSQGSVAIGIEVDVANEDSVIEMVDLTVKEKGRVDVLVNNAGIGIRKQPQELTEAEWDSVVDVNLKGAFLPSKAVHPHMVSIGGGKIINIGSMTSVFGLDWAAPYSATKGGVVQLAKTLAVAWAKDNIQVNTILPGWILTDLTAAIETRFPRRHRLISSRIPAGRWGTPDDFAGVAIFLASHASDYLTGASIPVDGGYTSF